MSPSPGRAGAQLRVEEGGKGQMIRCLILLPPCPGPSASCGPLGWSSHPFASSRGNHLSGISPSCGCRG